MLQVFDEHNRERDWAWLEREYWKMDVWTPYETPYYKLETVRITVGPAICQIDVVDKNGAPLSNIPVAFWFSTAPPIGADYRRGSMWHDNGVVQMTNNQGTTGFGLGGGAFVTGETGPHDIWICSVNGIKSQCVHGTGMKMGTDHAGPLRLKFMLVDELVPPEPPPDGQLEARVAAVEQEVSKIETWIRRVSTMWDEVIG